MVSTVSVRFATPLISSTGNTNINVAFGKPARQSTTRDDGEALKAVDGNRSPLRLKDLSCAHTEHAQPGRAWWYVDLLEDYPVGKVEIVARGEGYGSRFSNWDLIITTEVLPDGFNAADGGAICYSQTGPSVDGQVYHIYCNGTVGRYVGIRMRNSGAVLELCEVEVYLMNQDLDLEVRQFFDSLCEKKLNDQIEEELKASHIYLSMAHHFSRADVALFGFHKFFKKMSDEDRGHAQMLMEYVNKRGGTVTMGSSLTFHGYEELSTGDWNNALHAMETAMKMEHQLNRHLKEEVHKCATDNDDFHLQHHIESHLLTEQVDAIKQIGDYITKMERLGTGIGLHMFDEELQTEEKVDNI